MYLNEGTDGSQFNEVSDYDGISSTYVFTQGDIVDAFQISTGGFYRIKTTASNEIEVSVDSEELIVALAR